jgi:hypothetical protein
MRSAFSMARADMAALIAIHAAKKHGPFTLGSFKTCAQALFAYCIKM